MVFLETLRNRAFWIIDKIQGGEIKKYYNLLQVYCSEEANPQSIYDYQKKQIEKLLSETKKNVPYYKFMENITISSWPVVNKNLIKSNQDDFLSKMYIGKPLYKMLTSGSTGTPFLSLQNVEKKKHVNAEAVYYLGLQGYKVGRRIIFLRSLVKECRKSRLIEFCQNIYQLNCNDLSDVGISKQLKIIEKLSKKNGAILIAYASTYEAFHRYFERNGYELANKCKIISVTSGSEMLYDSTRASMEKAFNCKCYSRYANEENGFLGQDNDVNNLFFINNANYYIEILKFDSDEPAQMGEKGRIVVTDLYNYAQPMIRYDTGDVGAFVEIMGDSGCRNAIGEFGGRAVDRIFDTKGKLISPHSITNTMWEFQQIKQFQFVQKAKKSYCIKINIENEQFCEKKLINLICSVVGSDAEIKIEYCNDIPVLSSGKRRYIVNEMESDRL